MKWAFLAGSIGVLIFGTGDHAGVFSAVYLSCAVILHKLEDIKNDR